MFQIDGTKIYIPLCLWLNIVVRAKVTIYGRKGVMGEAAVVPRDSEMGPRE